MGKGLIANHMSASTHLKMGGVTAATTAYKYQALAVSGAVMFKPGPSTDGDGHGAVDQKFSAIAALNPDAAYIFSGSVGAKNKAVFLGDLTVSGTLKSGGGTNINGSGKADRMTYWTDADTITYSDNFTFTGTALETADSTITSVLWRASGEVGLDSSAGVVNIATGSNTAALNIGTAASARTITVGNAAATAVNVNAIASTITTVDALTLTDGTATLALGGTGATSLAAATTVDLDCTGNLQINSSAGTLSIGNDDIDQNISIGTQGVRTTALGNAASTAVTVDALAVTLTSVNALTMTDGTATLALAGTGATSLAAATTVDLDCTGAMSLNSSAGVINIGDDAVAANNINIGTGNAARTIALGHAASTAVTADALAVTLTSVNALTLTDGTATLALAGTGATSLAAATTVDLDCTSTMSLNSSAGVINIGDDAVAQNINVGTGAAARTITVGNVTGATALDVNLGTGGMTVDCEDGGAISLDANGAPSNFTLTSTAAADDLTIALAGATDSSLVLSSTGTGADALQITTTAGGIDITCTGAGGEDIDIDATTSSVNIDGGEEAADAVRIVASHANGAIDIDSGVGGITIDTTGAFSIDGADASNITVLSDGADENLTLSVTGATASSLILASAGTGTDAIDINATAGGMDVDVAGAINIATTGAAGDISLTSVHTGGVAMQLNANTAATSELEVNAGIMDVNVTGGYELDATGISLDSDAASNFITSGGALTLTSAVAATWSTSAGALTLGAGTNIALQSANGVTTNAGIFPTTDNALDLGASGQRWANIYTGDLHLANDRGNYTLVEEEEMLTIRNNRTGKWFKLMMEEIDPSGRDDGMQGVTPVLAAGPEWEI